MIIWQKLDPKVVAEIILRASERCKVEFSAVRSKRAPQSPRQEGPAPDGRRRRPEDDRDG